MDIGEIARAFNMTVAQFAKFVGYSRQALYQNDIRISHRSKAMLHHLKELNARMLQMDQEEAKRRCEERIRAIDEFEKRILKAGDTDGH